MDAGWESAGLGDCGEWRDDSFSHRRAAPFRAATLQMSKGDEVTSRPVADLLETLAEPTRLHSELPVHRSAVRVGSVCDSRSPRWLRSVLDAVRSDPAAQTDRAAALDRSRSRFETRVRGAVMNAS